MAWLTITPGSHGVPEQRYARLGRSSIGAGEISIADAFLPAASRNPAHPSVKNEENRFVIMMAGRGVFWRVKKAFCSLCTFLLHLDAESSGLLLNDQHMDSDCCLV